MQPKSVLVTGGCGFIGSNFINYISKKWPNAIIVNLDKLQTGSSQMNVDQRVRSHQRYHFVYGDYKNENLVQQVLQEYDVDTVVHFAAMTHVDESYEYPLETLENNVTSTFQFLRACSSYGGIVKFIHISTDEVYGDSETGPLAIPKKETDPLDPTNPYAASKAACEQMVHCFRHSNKLPAVMVRMNNVYGPRQYESKLIPKCISLFENGQPFTLQGNGSQLRNWLYVDDACDAISMLVENGKCGQIYNIGSPNEHSILFVANSVHKIVSQYKGINFEPLATVSIPDRLYNDQRYLIDSRKIKEQIGWVAKTTFEEGLKKTVDWYLKRYRRRLSSSHA